MNRKYIIITPVRDEIDTINLVIKSVTEQTIKPVQWLIIDDGSTDGTREVLSEYAQRFDWIRVILRPFRSERIVGENVVHILNEGLEAAKRISWDFWAKLDADVSIQADHYEKLFDAFEREPKLGIASGISYLPDSNGKYRLDWTAPHQPLGMSRIYRRECWVDIKAFAPRRHWDVIDIYSAQYHGWVTKSFPSIPVTNYRIIDAAQKNPVARRYDAGFNYYTMGYHPIYLLARSIRVMWDEKPYIMSGISMFIGYLIALITRQQFYDERLKTFIRVRQWEMMRPKNLYSYLIARINNKHSLPKYK
jgi:poly-beta-1,6-N-acetyl-D-glucosamine synthase